MTLLMMITLFMTHEVKTQSVLYQIMVFPHVVYRYS